MGLFVAAVIVYNVLILSYCQGKLISQAVLTKNTPTSRAFVCKCSDAASCTADKWKDLLAECRQKTETLKHKTTSEQAQETTTPSEETTTPASCVSDCTGLGEGDYQSCERCDGFLKCWNGQTFHSLCPSSTEWDDNLKSCQLPPSPTCGINP